MQEVSSDKEKILYDKKPNRMISTKEQTFKKKRAKTKKKRTIK